MNDDFEEFDLPELPTDTSAVQRPQNVGTNAPQPKRKFDPALRAKAAKAQQVLQNEVNDFVKRATAQKPELADLSINASVIARVRSTKGSSAVLKTLIDTILSPTVMARTRSEIREVVQCQHPTFAVYKDWNKPLPNWALNHTRKRLLGCFPVLRSLKTTSTTTLNQLYAGARALFAKEAGAMTFRPVVTIDRERVIVNGAEFKISVNRSNGRSYEMVRLNMQKFIEALHAQPQ
jgi:hypothetical protein